MQRRRNAKMLCVAVLLLLIAARLLSGCDRSGDGQAGDTGRKPADSSQEATVKGPDWFPFTMPWVDNSDNVINAGKLLLDAPAGKHGFLQVKDGHFYFDNGKRFKLWGVNLVAQANFLSHKEAENLAQRLAKYGFNIVRLHQMDFHSAPNGIFKRNSSNTLSLDEEQMDKLDYLVYQLKMRGIYVDINLYTGRKFTEADGVVEAKDLPDKYVTLYDKKLIELEKDYARQLLTHYNPYTKTQYNEEPGVAFVEISNEDSLFRAWQYGALNRKLPPFYNKELDDLWMNWLRGKYADREELAQAWAQNGEEGVKGLEPGETLEGDGVKRIDFAETAKFSAGRAADMAQFYYEVERSFFQDMMSYIHGELGVKVPVSTTNNYYGQANLMSRTEGDFIDSHAYWLNSSDKEGEGFSLLQHSTYGEDSDKNVESDPIPRLAQSAVAGKPFVVSEWNATAPNEYEYELAGLMTAYAMLQDWDGMIVHMYYNGKEPFVQGYISKGNETANNPVKLAQLQACGIAFQRGYVRPAEKQLLLRYTKQDVFQTYRDYGMRLNFNVPGKLPLVTTFVHGLRKTFDTDATSTVGDLLPAGELKSLQEDNVYRSDTGEIVWDAKEAGGEYATFDTPKFQGAVGFVQGKDVRLGNLELKLSTNSSVFLTSIDGKNLATSGQMLLTAVSSQKNTGQSDKNEKNKLGGKAPVLMKTVRGEVEMKVKVDAGDVPNAAKGGAFAVYALDSVGNRAKEVSAEWSAGVLKFRIGDDSTSWYEIVRK